MLLVLLACALPAADTGATIADTGPAAPRDLDGDGWIALEHGGQDCNDLDPAVHPRAGETCNGIDDDCDGVIDPPGSLGTTTWYRDADGDGWGDASRPAAACSAPPGHVVEDGDCDDADPAVHPGAEEVCNGLDDDCDGEVDPWNARHAPIWYPDEDGDGHGDPTMPSSWCEAPAGFTSLGDDCDDTAPDVYPGAPERCDGFDTDCDGVADPPACPARRGAPDQSSGTGPNWPRR